ncbi:replication-associated recombination protein A [Massilicoli timonensis]|uniref:replication-associated recombination protein A n=1 Tax=Massilicoli timonensis TaxID=2015901 RepID=UPI000C85DA96|nr:replication-associated recombination protein A [Massilicoli timonensis]
MEPLAYRMRPQTPDEIVGQKHLIAPGKVLRRCVEAKRLFSMIFYGPPGTGKTTMATVLAQSVGLPYRMFNAVSGNKKDLDRLFEEAKLYPGLVVIIDEVHRLNKDKQDLLLPYVEKGMITMIGATTANPYHAINPAIRSRCHIFEFYALSTADCVTALRRALESEKGLNHLVEADDALLSQIAIKCGGDLRQAMNVLELCAYGCENGIIEEAALDLYLQKGQRLLDKNGDGYYNVLSAFQKSIRGSDVDAALYYLAAMIEAQDMDAIERRLLVCAYEDVGLGNPAAVARCVNAIDAAKRVGFPEGRIPLSQAVIDLCLSPKSKSAEAAIDKAMQALHQYGLQMPPYLHYTPVTLAENERYDYGRSDLWDQIQYLPDPLKDASFYTPQTNSQYEQVLAGNLKKLKRTKRTASLAQLKKGTNQKAG